MHGLSCRLLRPMRVNISKTNVEFFGRITVNVIPNVDTYTLASYAARASVNPAGRAGSPIKDLIYTSVYLMVIIGVVFGRRKTGGETSSFGAYMAGAVHVNRISMGFDENYARVFRILRTRYLYTRVYSVPIIFFRGGNKKNNQPAFLSRTYT